MSHNKNTVNTIAPDRSGEINQSIGDLSDVSISNLTANDVLKYDGTNFVNAALTSSQYILIGQGESNAYSNSGRAQIASGWDLYLYDTAPLNTISNAIINKVSGTDWISSVTLPIGKYQILSNVRVEFTASGSLQWALHDGSQYESGRAVIGESLSSYSYPSTLASSFYTTAVRSMTIRVVTASSVDTVANQGNTVSEFSSLYIEKLD
jgi:hypothetical protein